MTAAIRVPPQQRGDVAEEVVGARAVDLGGLGEARRALDEQEDEDAGEGSQDDQARAERQPGEDPVAEAGDLARRGLLGRGPFLGGVCSLSMSFAGVVWSGWVGACRNVRSGGAGVPAPPEQQVGQAPILATISWAFFAVASPSGAEPASSAAAAWPSSETMYSR